MNGCKTESREVSVEAFSLIPTKYGVSWAPWWWRAQTGEMVGR